MPMLVTDSRLGGWIDRTNRYRCFVALWRVHPRRKLVIGQALAVDGGYTVH